MKLKHTLGQQRIKGFYAYDREQMRKFSSSLVYVYSLAKAGRDTFPDDVQEDDIFQCIELEDPLAKCFQQYVCKWRNIVERYTGPLVQVRQAHAMMLYALCKTLSFGVAVEYHDDFNSMMHLLRQRVRYHANLNTMPYSGCLDGRQKKDIARRIVQKLFISSNILCAFSSDCRRCIFAYIIHTHIRTDRTCKCWADSYLEDVPERNVIHRSEGCTPYFGVADRFLSLITRDQHSVTTMIRQTNCHMATLSRILNSGMNKQSRLSI